MDVILASSSPRRAKLLTQLFDDFKIIPPKIDESKYPVETLSGHRFDLVVDAVGNLGNACRMASLLKDGGKLGLYGVLSREKANMNIFDVPNNISIHTLNWPYHEHWVNKEVCDLVVRGILVPSQYYSHVLPMQEAETGFELVRERKAFKVILQMPGVTEE